MFGISKACMSALLLAQTNAHKLVASDGLLHSKEENENQHGKIVLEDGSWASSDADPKLEIEGFDRNMLPMTKEKFELVVHAITRSTEIYDTDSVPEGVTDHPFVSGLDRIIDRMFTEENDDICMVTWMGTDTNIRDWLQNANMIPRTVGDGFCLTTMGLWQAFSGAGSGVDAGFVPVLDAFVEGCTENEKQIVFTGHSQGAGAAGIAQAIYTDHNPISIMFGNAPWIMNHYLGLEHCAPRPTEIWRFINSENMMVPSPVDQSLVETIKFDLVPNLNRATDLFQTIPELTYNAGGYIVLPPGDSDGNMVPMTDSVAYFGTENPEMDITVASFDVSAHFGQAYLKKILDLNDLIPEDGELDVSGFVDGTNCYASDECQGACEFESYISPVAKCAAKLATGERCNEHDDCLSDHCGGWNPFNWRCLD